MVTINLVHLWNNNERNASYLFNIPHYESKENHTDYSGTGVRKLMFESHAVGSHRSVTSFIFTSIGVTTTVNYTSKAFVDPRVSFALTYYLLGTLCAKEVILVEVGWSNHHPCGL